MFHHGAGRPAIDETEHEQSDENDGSISSLEAERSDEAGHTLSVYGHVDERRGEDG